MVKTTFYINKRLKTFERKKNNFYCKPRHKEVSKIKIFYTILKITNDYLLNCVTERAKFYTKLYVM